MQIDLTAREVPTPGEQLGVFAKVIKAKRPDKRGREYTYLVLVGELKATKTSGKRFTASCSYNLDDGRGLSKLREHLQTWRGSNTLPDLSNFVPEQEFLNKTFLAKPTVSDKGGMRTIQFSGFKPYNGESPLTVSPDFAQGQEPGTP